MTQQKLSSIPNIEQDKFVAAIETMRRNMQLTIEYHIVQAKIRRESYKAYISEGFTEAQALELCTKF